MKKIANFHSHTELCRHAVGLPVDYVKQAEREGCTALGVSDHCPYPESFGDTWQHVRMSVEEVPLYLESIRQAKEQASFPIYTGYECEWDRNFASWYCSDLREKCGADYLVLGSHWLVNGSERIWAGNLGTVANLHAYVDQTIEGMASGAFAFLAHPDLFMAGWKEWDQETEACLKAILDAAVDLNLPLEVNGLGLSREPNETSRGMRCQYPYVEFWEMVAQTKCRVICNSDAHKPQDILMNAWKSRDFALRFGIEPIELPDFVGAQKL